MPRTASAEPPRAILDASMRLFSRYGFRKTTVEEIARAAGVGKGSIYLHFENKEQILLTLLRLNAQRILEAVREACAAAPSPADELRTALKVRAAKVYRFYHRHIHALELVPWLLAQPEHARIMDKLKQAHIRHLGAILEEGVRRDEFGPLSDTAGLARHIHTMAFAFMPPYRTVKTLPDLESHVDRYVDGLLAFLKAPGRAHPDT